MMAKLVIIPTTVGFIADTSNKLNRLLKQPRLIIAGGHHLVCITIMNMGLVMKTGLVIYHYMLYIYIYIRIVQVVGVCMNFPLGTFGTYVLPSKVVAAHLNDHVCLVRVRIE